MMSKFKIIFLSVIAVSVLTVDSLAQLNLGVDVASRYVWRGADFGNSPSIQPDISASFGNFEIGAWAAIATQGDPEGTEVDWYASYTIDTNASGSFSLSLTDYTFPELPTGNYFSKEAHFLEGAVGYSGPSSFPVSISTGVFFTNDDDYSIYTEIGYEIKMVNLFFGFTPKESELYGTRKAGVINTGISASKAIRITDSFSINLNTSIIGNPHSDDLFFVFGIGI
ncbi:MAG: hypothetical protein ACFCU6_02045 [Balneolaceae bacterium]